MNASPPAPPVKVAELLLPTVLALAGRGPVSAENFLTALAGTRVTAHAGDTRPRAVAR
ncbi:hypothetical protein SAMN05421837_104573 [Amycolatopsis pretoriensis]|uniref:Uncharacterized protein n=1 Tax=Amycolatopsis pretoriensis TaxID=218821 RepID=A0A1H5QSX5_9PSEU|nr:hypothetical protein [Amycolatopsis pretoriensis]SEF29175.1 hypothetical protein SAMN05421837_104573 [Amycolatopsis pretoriensis]